MPRLKAEGADAIVLLIHQGGKTPVFNVGNGCDGLDGGIVPILAKLDPAIHRGLRPYPQGLRLPGCRGRTSADRLLTSAGKNGYFVTDIRLHSIRASASLDRPATRQPVMSATASAAMAPDVQSLVDRYAAAVRRSRQPAHRSPWRRRQRARITTGKARPPTSSPTPCSPRRRRRQCGCAQIALVNVTGCPCRPASRHVRYADAFSMMPFGNNLVVMTLTGAQMKTVLEQQFAGVARAAGPACALAPSPRLHLHCRRARNRAATRRGNGAQRQADRPRRGRYRVAVNNFLASGGDGFTGLRPGTDHR